MTPASEGAPIRKVRALFNPKSGFGLGSAETVREALQEA